MPLKRNDPDAAQCLKDRARRRTPWWARAVRLLALLLLLAGMAGTLLGTVAAAPAPQEDGPTTVYVLTFEGAVTPVLQQYLDRGVASAVENGAEALVLQLNTPGGSVNVTKSIVQDMLSAPLPVMVYVAPSGATAGSAGTFITLAGHIAAMAPGSSIGAASPVDMSGADVGDTMEAKITNILSADIENLAERRGEEATAWAIAAVEEAAAATAGRALDLGVIDFIAQDVGDLLQQSDGVVVTVAGQERTLRTAGAMQVPLDLSPLQQLLNFISDPAIASILLSLGTLGLIIELRSPGFGVPGIVGAICLLMAFYALGQLEASVAGMALLALAVALFIAETFTPTFGVLAGGGIIAFLLGAALLFDSPDLTVPWSIIITVALLLGGFTIFAGSMALAAQRRRPKTGGEGLIGRIAKAKSGFGPGEVGSVFVSGEWWNAEVEEGEIQEGEEVEVVERRGYTLMVRKRPAGA